jgi:catechol 2,3-dioxygenase-like lactoylglutathione lyase family enzyme
MVEGLSHLTFIVRDLEKMTRILVEVLGATEIYASGEATFSIAREKFFLAGGVWIAIMEGEPSSQRGYDHVAFKIGRDDLAGRRAAIERLGLEIRESRPRVDGEGDSIYFYDHDNHLFELHAGTLDERLRRYAADGVGEA